MTGQYYKRLLIHLKDIASEEVPATAAWYIMYQAIEIIDL